MAARTRINLLYGFLITFLFSSFLFSVCHIRSWLPFFADNTFWSFSPPDFWGWLAFSGDRTVLDVWHVLSLRVFPGNTPFWYRKRVSGKPLLCQKVLSAKSAVSILLEMANKMDIPFPVFARKKAQAAIISPCFRLLFIIFVPETLSMRISMVYCL